MFPSATHLFTLGNITLDSTDKANQTATLERQTIPGIKGFQAKCTHDTSTLYIKKCIHFYKFK